MQQTSLKPFFDSSEKHIQRILKQPNAILYKRFDKNMDITLQKLGSNAFTKTIRNILDRDKVFLGYSGSSVHGSEVPVYSVFVGDQNLLAGIIPDIIRCSPDTQTDIIDTIRKLEANSSQILKLKKNIDDKSLEKVVKLKESNDELQEVLASMLDYGRIAEAIYFSFIRYIVSDVDRGSSSALFDNAILLFKKIISLSIGHVMEINNKDVYDAAMDYIFTVSFTNLRPREIMINIERRYGAEVADMLNSLNITSINNMEKLSSLLSLIKVVNITPITLNNAIAKRFGTSVLSMIYATYDYFIAWATVSTHHSVLFNMGPIDRGLQQNIERIILNYKSKVRM